MHHSHTFETLQVGQVQETTLHISNSLQSDNQHKHRSRFDIQNGKNIWFYSHIGEMCNLCEITKGQFLQGIVGGLYILQMVVWKKGKSNPHGIAPARFWVWCAYQISPPQQ